MKKFLKQISSLLLNKNKISNIVANGDVCGGDLIKKCEIKDYNIVKVTGKKISKILDLPNSFSTLINNTAFDIFVLNNTNEHNEVALIKGQKNIVDLIELNSSNDKLQFDTNANYSTKIKCEIFIYSNKLKNLVKIQNNSIGNIEIGSLSISESVLELNTQCTGDIKINDINVHFLVVKNESTGNINIDHLISEELTVNSNSTGDINIKSGNAKLVSAITNSTGDINLLLNIENASFTSNSIGDISYLDTIKNISKSSNSIGNIYSV